jgi:hypothetical protein
MTNATYVDQCDTIRTLTEEEMAVVSGGNFDLESVVWRYQHTNWTPSYYPNYNSYKSLNFLQRVYLDSSGWSNFSCIWGALMN